MEELINSFSEETKVLWDRFQNGDMSAEEWHQRMTAIISRYHIAAWMMGSESEEIDAEQRSVIDSLVDFQLGFLAAFVVKILVADSWVEGWQAQALLYPPAIKVAYWRARTWGLPLPGMPAEGTQCMNNCGCEWNIIPIDEGAGDYDAYWVRGKSDSCQTCLEREEQWGPVHIRNGYLIEESIKEIDFESIALDAVTELVNP